MLSFGSFEVLTNYVYSLDFAAFVFMNSGYTRGIDEASNKVPLLVCVLAMSQDLTTFAGEELRLTQQFHHVPV